MTIVVNCSCQTEYEFDVEPVDGKMPGPVYCPTCGADGTEYANWVIEQALAGEQEAVAEPVQQPRIGLRQPAREAAAVEATGDEEPGLPKFCYLHEREPMEAFCLQCKKPICQKCMKQNGYFCSPFCRRRAEQSGMDIPEYAGQERVRRARETKMLSRIATLSVLGLLGLFIAYEWYQIWGQKPSVKFTLPVTENDRPRYVRFLNDHEFLMAGNERLTVYDFKKKQETWTQSLAAYRPAKPEPVAWTAGHKSNDESGEESVGEFKPPTPEQQKQLMAQMEAAAEYYDQTLQVYTPAGSIVLALGRNLLCFDRATGAEKWKTKVDGRIEQLTAGNDALLVVSQKAVYDRIFTRIEPATGKTDSEQRFLPSPAARSADADDYAVAAREGVHVPNERHEFVAAGATVAAFDVKLVEKRLATIETMKKPDPKKFEGGVKASQSIEFAEDVMNELGRMRSGGTRRVDESRYAVTIQRVFHPDAKPWTGEVVGPPSLFALKTVDVLVAGKQMMVFDRNNQKLWESTLSYPIGVQGRPRLAELGDEEEDGEIASGPCVERGDTLYFFDLGVLTAFDLKTGNARWRMPSVGVSKIQFDDKGMLYVTTTTASPDSIKYFDDVNLTDQPESVIVKIDPANGKALWRVQKVGDQCYLSGKFVYISKARGSGGLMSLVAASSGKGTPTNFRIYRLNPKNGKKLWELYRDGQPGTVDFHNNEILLLFSDKLEVLKFLTL
jgi:outer membrane protein assembly factor BamB